MKIFLCSYWFKGDKWGFEIHADSMEDAAGRLRQIAASAQLDGELIAKIPVPRWWERLVPWVHKRP